MGNEEAGTIMLTEMDQAVASIHRGSENNVSKMRGLTND